MECTIDAIEKSRIRYGKDNEESGRTGYLELSLFSSPMTLIVFKLMFYSKNTSFFQK